MLAFSRRADGSLRQIGTFSTHGTGQLNLPKVVGPDDSSQEHDMTLMQRRIPEVHAWLLERL